MPAHRPSHRHHRGTALALAILLSVVITGLVMCLALGASIQSNTTASLIRTEPAFYAAEYAAQDSIWRYKNDNTYRAALNTGAQRHLHHRRKNLQHPHHLHRSGRLSHHRMEIR